MGSEIDFTIRTIEALPSPASGRVEYRDKKNGALRLRVTPTGVKTFSYFGRAKGAGQPERVTLGRFPVVRPEEARRMAAEIAGRTAGGESVAKANRERRGAPTLGEAWKAYRAQLDAKAQAAAEGIWHRHVEPAFGKRRMPEITPAAIERWHKALPAQIVRGREAGQAAREAQRRAEREARAQSRAQRRRGPDPKPEAAAPVRHVTGHRAANQALDLVRAIYSWATRPTTALFSGENPAARIDRFKEASRRRFLQPDELRPFFAALAEEPNETMRDFFLVALLTGARRGNVLAMRWVRVHLERAEWTIHGDETKNGEPQTVTLVPEVVDVLRRRQTGSASEFVFPSVTSKTGHVVEPKGAWRRVLTRAGIADLRIHDLRRSLGSWQLRTGASLALIGKSLNHLSQDATAIYAHLDLDPIRQSVTRATSAMFEAAGIKPMAEVVALPTKKTPKHGRKQNASA